MSPFHVTVRANAGAKHTYHSCGIVVCNVSHPRTIEPTPNINAMKPAALPICDLGGMRPAVIIPLAITPPPPRQAPMKAELMIRPTPIDEMECHYRALRLHLQVMETLVGQPPRDAAAARAVARSGRFFPELSISRLMRR